MQELDVINKRLGGHRITLAGLKALVQRMPEGEMLEVVEIGCGGGDNLRVIKDWCTSQGRVVHLTGVDINRECILYAEGRTENAGIHFIHSDYRTAPLSSQPHVVCSSLFCHHFTDPELVHMLQWMKAHSRIGFFINDLHRHPLAFYSIKFLTTLFSRSRLVKHDAPLSVKRGFIRREWNALAKAAELTTYSCRWHWAFRWLVSYRNA